MTTFQKTLEIRTSPHIVSGVEVDVIMRNVVYALLPIAAFAIYAFGYTALVLLVFATASCVLAEHLLCILNRKNTTIGDWSAVITGLLYGLTLPPGLPLWMVASGGFIAIGLGKFMFGGLGNNKFNPALVGRAVLQAAFPVAMTTWVPAFSADRFDSILASSLTFPFATPEFLAVTSATPLGAMKFDHQMTESFELAMGLINGSTGETSSFLILLGGLYLASRKMLNWRIPISIFAAVVVFSGIFHLIDPAQYPSPIFMLFSGGLMLGAVFMATDMVASPMTTLGVIIYGGLIGVMIVVIRIWGGLPEGVMYAILFGNAFSPLIDKVIHPTVYGLRPGRGTKKQRNAR